MVPQSGLFEKAAERSCKIGLNDDAASALMLLSTAAQDRTIDNGSTLQQVSASALVKPEL